MKRINIIAWDNGFGLTRHIRLLTDALQSSGYHVTVSPIRRGKLRKWLRPLMMFLRGLWFRFSNSDAKDCFDANIMIERIRPEYLRFARVNLFAPHPEWCSPKDTAMLEAIDGVLCMTHHAEPIFSEYGCRTFYMGFTSEDCRDLSVPRERKFFHLAGRSRNKGTQRLLKIWREHPQWPTLTVVQSSQTAEPGTVADNITHCIGHLDEAELRRLQNSHKYHICTSETEGYGHYLVEAMGIGAVVLATDAAPMNEMVAPERGILIPYDRTGKQNLATTYFFSEQGLVDAVTRALAMDDAKVTAIGMAARTWFVNNDGSFPGRIAVSLEKVFENKALDGDFGHTKREAK